VASGSSHPASLPAHPAPDVLIAGAGIIGLSLALELHSRGARVLVLERDTALAHASTAAAGMLALHDPHNPPALLPLTQLSADLYPEFLERIQQLSGITVPFQTDTTLQYRPSHPPQCLTEHSLDPRNLAAALLAAIRATGIKLREHTEFQLTTAPPNTTVIYTTGAWVPEELRRTLPVRPRKGQMLRVQLPPSLGNLREVHRSDQIYIVPRTVGTQAGTALIGATIEDAGFDTSTHTRDLIHLRDLAAMLLPALASEKDAPQLEAWAGLRPYTPDRLPILGPVEPGSHRFLATGHYRNGILLAPATAILLADLITGKTPALDLMPFSPARFSQS
jgi:glycine oxidase